MRACLSREVSGTKGMQLVSYFSPSLLVKSRFDEIRRRRLPRVSARSEFTMSSSRSSQ